VRSKLKKVNKYGKLIPEQAFAFISKQDESKTDKEMEPQQSKIKADGFTGQHRSLMRTKTWTNCTTNFHITQL